MIQDVRIRLCRGGRFDPNAICFGSESAKSRAADQVSLEVEGVVDGCVGGEKTLS